MKKKSSKPKKNPTDPILLAREVFEAAIGEPLTPKRPKAKKASSKKKAKK